VPVTHSKIINLFLSKSKLWSLLSCLFIYTFLYSSLYASSEFEFVRPSLRHASTTQAGQSIESLGPERQFIWKNWINQFKDLHGTGVTREQIDEFDHASPEAKGWFCLFRVQIIDQKIYAHCYTASLMERANMWLTGLQKVVDQYKIKNVDLVIPLGDGLPTFNNRKVTMPIFCSDSLNLEDRNIILVPDLYTMSFWAGLYEKIKAAHCVHSWGSKVEKVFWRGAGTGGEYNLSTYEKFVRSTLVMMSSSFPEKIDARFAGPIQFVQDQDGALEKKFNSLSLMAPRIDEVDHLTHKYLISMDGNVSAWVRPLWIMASNSVLMFQHKYHQYYYAALEPWKHFVPLKEDISDIFERFDWLKSHDNEAKQITENANRFLEAAMKPEHVTEDLAFLLNSYASLQRFDLVKPTLPQVYPKMRIFNPKGWSFQGSLSHEMLGSGWSTPEATHRWTEGKESRVILPLPAGPARDLNLVIEGGAFVHDNHPRLGMAVLVNDVSVTILEYNQNSPSTRSVQIPAGVAFKLADEMNITFQFDKPISPKESGFNADPRVLGLTLKSLRLGE
jgi:hypothetical protein